MPGRQGLLEWATRALFFVGGFAAAVWAALIPFAKSRAALDDGQLGLLLLCLGGGSIVAMPLTGALVTRFGCRRVLSVAVVVLCAALPWLASLSAALPLAVTVACFGAALGVADSAFNIQAVMVEGAADRPLMSGFHGCYSVGGIVGAAGATAVLTAGWSPVQSALGAVVFMAIVTSVAYRGLLTGGKTAGTPMLALPHGIVLWLGMLCFVVFLVEGSVLDWSGVYLVSERGVSAERAGMGFAAFATAMTVARLLGDAIVRALGPVRIVAGGALLTAAGLIVAIVVPDWRVALSGYALVGLGCANIVPVLFSATGRQRTMPQAAAVSALTTMGYAGILAGPAAIGFIARASSLRMALTIVALLLVVVLFGSGTVNSRR